MFWADKLLEKRNGKEFINDSWTPSGNIHMGGIKGPIIHDVLFMVLKQKGADVKYTFGFDDFDPIDGLPSDLIKTHEKYMGVPISIAPSPDGNGSFGDFYSRKMEKLFKTLDIKAKIYKTSVLYKNGTFNKAIKFVLDNAEKIRKVYEEIYQKKVANDWYPLQVVCPKCGKLGTTKVVNWDGEKVSFECREDLVKWAKGCGYKGKINPFNGSAKMPFKVEWAAKWWTFGVTIEGAGKDHASAGGTYDVAMKILTDVFNKKPPLKLPYEHFLSEGRKMASSKGVGITAEELLEVIPPQMARFLMIKTKPNQAVEFSIKKEDLFPKLYDEYQKVANAYLSKKQDDNARTFELSQVKSVEKPPSIRFSILSNWVQMPNMEERIKEENLTKWAKYAKVWVEKYAPESGKFLIQEKLPEIAKKLTREQKDFLKKISKEIDKSKNPDDFQRELYKFTKELNISSKDAFQAIYLSLIGKDHGPKAGWLILSLDKKFVKKRFNEI